MNNATKMSVKDLRLPYCGDEPVRWSQGWQWFIDGLRDFFTRKYIPLFLILLIVGLFAQWSAFIPFVSDLLLATMASAVFIYMVECHYHGSCTFNTMFSELGKRFMRILLVALSIWIMNWVLWLIAGIIILILYGSAIWGFCQWMISFCQENNVLGAFESGSGLDLVIEKFANVVSSYVISHPEVFLHGFLVYSISLVTSCLAFMCRFFAVPLAIYGEVSAPKALWISFKSCIRNCIPVGIAWSLYGIVCIAFMLPIFFVGFFTSGLSSGIGVAAITGLIIQLFFSLLSTFWNALIDPLGYFVKFRMCQSIYWARYDQMLHEAQEKFTSTGYADFKTEDTENKNQQ